MWVSKDAWDRLRERLADLERKVQSNSQITVYKNIDIDPLLWTHSYMNIPKASISLESVVRGLCERVGYELVYQAGTPETVLLQKKEKAK